MIDTDLKVIRIVKLSSRDRRAVVIMFAVQLVVILGLGFAILERVG